MSNTKQQARFLRFIKADESEPSLQRLVKECLHIKSGDLELEVASFSLTPSKKDQTQTLTLIVRLSFFETDDDLVQTIVSFKEQELSLGEFPMMTDRGTFTLQGEELTLTPQRALPSGLYFSREGANTRAHIVLARDDGESLGCAELEITRHRKGDLSLRMIAAPNVPISYLFPSIQKKKDLPAKFVDKSALCEWMRPNVAPGIINHSAIQAKLDPLQEAFSRSCCSLHARQEQLWLPLENIPEGLRLGEHVTDTSGNIRIPQGELVQPHVAALRADGVTEFLISRASLRLFIAIEDAFDPQTGEILFESGQDLISGHRCLAGRHTQTFTFPAVYCSESFDETSEADVWRMSRASSLICDSAFVDGLRHATQEVKTSEGQEMLVSTVSVCCWLLEGLSKTKGVFLPKPSELPLLDTIDTFVQVLWGCLQRLRGAIRQRLDKEQGNAKLYPKDLVPTGALSRYLHAALTSSKHFEE